MTAYRKWIKDIEELQTVKVNIRLVSDVDCTVLKKVRRGEEMRGNERRLIALL